MEEFSLKTIGEYRARYPQLRELTDYQLTRAVYDTTAPDMPLEDFAKAFGGVTEEDPEEVRIQEYNLSHPDDTIRREDMGKASLLSDTGHGIAAGINELAAIPFWLAEEAGIESAGKAKDYFLKSAEEKRKGYSPEMKLARAEEFFTEEPDGSYGFGGAWTSPRKILGSVAESAPGMVGGMGLSALAARGLIKAGLSRGLAWAVGSSVGEGTIGGAQNALNVHETILAMPEDKLADSPEYQELLQRTGDPKQAREELANSVAAMTGLKTGASTAVLSAPSGYMFGKILGGETGKTLLGTAAKQGAAEFGEEAGQSGAEQYLSQAELQRADPTIDPMSGVGEAAVSGGFAGMAMGGGMGGFGHVLGGRAQQQPGAPAVSDAQPVLPPEQQAALPEGGHGSPLELGPGQNIVMGTDRAYEDPIATPPPTSPLQKGMEAILGGPLGLSTAPAAPDFAVTPGGRAVSANGIVQPDAFGPIAAGMRSDMPPLLADQVYDVEYSVVPGAPKALSEAPRGLPLGQDKSPVAPESPQPVAVQTDGESTPLQLTRINDKSFMLHGDTGPFEEAIKAAGGRLDRKVGGWRFPLAREGEIRELFGIPLGAETVPGDNFVSEVPEASPEVLRETPLPVSGDMAMSGQTGLEVTHGGLQQGTPGAGTGELLSESVPVDAAGNPGELAAAARGSGRYHGDLGNRPDLDTALPGVDGREAGLGAAVQRTAGSVEVPGEGRGQNVSFNQIPTIPDSGRSASGRGDEPAFRGLPEVGRDVSGGSKGTKNASFEKNGRKGIERKLLRAIERQQGGVSPEAEAWAHGLNPQERKKAYEQLVLNEFKRHTASELGVDEESLRFIPVRKDSETSLRLKEIGGVFGQDVVIFKDSSSVQTGIRGASVPTIEHVVFMEGSAEREKPYLFVLGHELLHRMRSEDLKAYKQFQEYLLDDLQEGAIPRYRENLDRRTGGDGTVARMSDEAILEEIGADLVGKRLTEESFWAKMADERPSLFARVSQFVRDLLDRVTAAFRADPLPAAWVKDFDAIRRHIDAMMGQWAEKNARAKTGGTPPHSGNTREVLDGRDETVRNAGRNGGEGSDHAGGLLQSNRGRHGAPVDLVGDGGRGEDGGRAAQPAPEGREGERPRQPVAVKIPNRADEPAHYELLEADDVRASHLPSRGFQKNPAYGLENERRYHDEPGSRAKVMENAAKLDPAFLMESVDANHGAPVIDHDNNVLGGNGRAMSIARAYESFPERGEQYREALKANADRLGIDPAQVDAMHSPMLVRRLERGMSREERQQLVTAMNDDFKDAKEKRASGKSRGERFGRRTLDMLSAGLKDAESLREYFDTPASVAVVERMMEDGVIQRSERNALVGADGLLNPDGKKVVEEALRGRIARSYEALAKLPADVVGKLDAVIPHILVAEGIGKPWNITEHVRDSVDLLVGFKGSGVKEPDTYLKQVNMLTGRAPVQDFSKQAIALFRMALDAKKGEYVKAFESYLKNAKLSPEAGNIPGVAKPQDKAFRDAFGMKTEATPNKPEKREAEKPQTEEETKGQPPEKSPKKEPQEQTSGKPGDAGHVERHRALYKSLLNGKASLEDYHRGFSALLENEEAVRAELSGMTVNALLARGGAMFAWRHKGDKKADIVDALYRDMLSDFTLGQPYSVSGFMGMGPEEYRKATVASIRRIVDAQSEQTLADFARDAAAQREEYASRRKAEREAVENPKTLEDFRSFIRFHMDEGKTAGEARDLLSFEQREQFDRLAAEASRSTRKTKAEPVLSSSSQTTGGEIIATKHTQKGHDLFVVRLEDRVSREDYLALLSSAKKLGGYYSKFRGNGAVPGFQFTGREQAEAFLKLAQGDKAEAQEAVKARRDAYEDDRSQTAVQRLNEMADRLDEDADASLNAARKVNTAKRAGQAAAADAMAYADKSLAKTMRNIAGAIGNGTATFLDRVREKKQVEQLRDALRMAKWEEDKTKYPAWDQREKHSEEPATTQTVEFAAFPHYRLYRSSWAELGRKLSEKDGTKSLGKKILSVADDVTETYLEFAHSHLEEVSTYATQAGKPAVFKSREDAEKAIARSGYRGKAVVLPVKRGENRIILSPSAAQERGIWKGDDDRMLSLRPELVDELFDKQGSTSRDIPWQLFDIRQKRKALARMGIETPAEYRMALREFVGLQAAAKQDKVRELERSVMRDAANNRGWLDFFPTPVAVTEEMLAAADIRPGMGVLEPSAGMGHIADRIREKGVEPVVAELEPQKRELLEAKGYEVIGKDFMKDIPEGESFDRIVMNPPFSKRQDTEHVRRAYDLLNPGGKLVAIVSEGSFFGKDKKASEFRDWLEEVGGTSEKLAEGSFNDPSLPVTTGVNTRMVVIEKEGTPMASVTPGEFLPAMPSTRLRIRKAAVQRVADALGKRAANAADTRGVQSFEELPEHIRQLYGDVASRLEGVYDPASGTVYLVADNLHSTARAAEVWMHENMVHHGLNGLLGMDEKRRVLNRLWQGMGGMGNAEIASVANKYGVDPLWDVKDRALVMEEYLARLAEKRAAGKLSDQEQTLWRRFVEAVLRAWHALVDAVTGRTGSMKYENVDRLLSALDRYVFEGRPEGMAEGGMVPAMASVDRSGSDMEAAHAAWAQVQRDAEEWGRQVDAFHPHEGTGGRQPRLMAVCRTPDVLQKLGAPDLPMTMTADNLGKVLSDKVDHGLPKELVKQLPQALAEPIMVFESASQADSFVVLTELKHEGRSVMAAVHLDTEKQRVRVNDIASAYKRSNEAWYARQIEEGRLLYQDKKKSLAWARTNRLQLPRVRKLPSRLSGKRVLTEEDIVKPIAPDNKPLASLRDIKDVRDITGMSAEDAMNLAKNDPWIGSIFGKSDDVTLMQRIFMLPHWVAKRFPGFKAVYDRQVRRQDERAAERARSLQEIPSLFGENKLSGKDMGELKKLVWDNDGKQIAELEGIDKFLTDEELESGRTTIKANPEWYEGYDKWLSRQPGSDAVKKAMREIRVSLDNDLMRAHNRLARMREMGDVAIQEFRTQIGHIHNYFPHHRYGDYFIQGKDKKGEVVYREHFDALHKRYARRHFENRLEALKKEYPDTVFDLDENTKLPDEAFGRVLDPEAMEQVIKAALSKVSDKEQADRIAEVLHESVADVMKSSGWGSHAIGRKNIPGFEKDDLFRVLYDYKSGLTGWLTKMESSKDFAEALGKINAKAHPQEWSYTSQYVKDMLRNGDRVDRTVGTIKSAAFAWYLGGNIKTAVLNLTQNVIVGVPRLQMDVEGGARAYIDGAQKQIVNQYARRFTGDKGKGLSEEEARLIQDLYGDALITDAYMEEVRGQVTGGPSTRLWNKLMKVMGYPMSVAERFNRGSLALAAFRAARDGKMKAAARKRYGVEGEKATYEQAKAFAEEIVRDSHFVYGKTNAPELLRSSTAGRGLGAAFTFKTFTANLLGLWSWALRTQGKEGAIMVAKGLGATAALGGLVSLPFYATLMALFQAATGDDDDWTEAIRKQLPQNTMLRDIVCYGLPAGAGVNLGGSLKMELALTGGMQKGGTPKEVLTEGIGDIIGIPWDMFVERPSKVMEAMRADNYWRAVEEVVPTAVSNGMKAWRLATEGQKTLKGRDINDPGEQGARKLSSGEAFGKLLGFQPVSATRSYDAYTASKHSDSVRADKADEVATIMVKALDAGDSAEMVRARKVLKDWNVKMEEEGKPHMRILMKDVQKRVTQRRRKARMTPKARQKGEAFQSVWGNKW